MFSWETLVLMGLVDGHDIKVDGSVSEAGRCLRVCGECIFWDERGVELCFWEIRGRWLLF